MIMDGTGSRGWGARCFSKPSQVVVVVHLSATGTLPFRRVQDAAGVSLGLTRFDSQEIARSNAGCCRIYAKLVGAHLDCPKPRWVCGTTTLLAM